MLSESCHWGAQKTGHCSLDAAGQCVVSMGFSPLERSLIAFSLLSPPQWQHRSYSKGIYIESSQFFQEDEEDLVIVGQCAHKQQKKRIFP